MKVSTEPPNFLRANGFPWKLHRIDLSLESFICALRVTLIVLDSKGNWLNSFQDLYLGNIALHTASNTANVHCWWSLTKCTTLTAVKHVYVLVYTVHTCIHTYRSYIQLCRHGQRPSHSGYGEVWDPRLIDIMYMYNNICGYIQFAENILLTVW